MNPNLEPVRVLAVLKSRVLALESAARDALALQALGLEALRALERPLPVLPALAREERALRADDAQDALARADALAQALAREADALRALLGNALEALLPWGTPQEEEALRAFALAEAREGRSPFA